MKKETKHDCDVEIFGSVVIGTKGQIVIPNEIRKKLNLQSGDSMIVMLKHDKAIGLVKSTDLDSFVQEMKQLLK